MRAILLALAAAMPVFGAAAICEAQQRQATPPQPIDCAASRLAAPGRHDCTIWSFRYNVHGRPNRWFEDSLPGAACVQERGAALTRSDRYFGFVKYFIPMPGADPDCQLSGGAAINMQKMRSIALMTRNASDLSLPQRSGDRFVSGFRSERGAACRAFVVLGPPALTRRHGDWRKYQLLGYLCPREGGTIGDADFDAYLAAINLRAG